MEATMSESKEETEKLRAMAEIAIKAASDVTRAVAADDFEKALAACGAAYGELMATATADHRDDGPTDMLYDVTDDDGETPGWVAQQPLVGPGGDDE